MKSFRVIFVKKISEKRFNFRQIKPIVARGAWRFDQEIIKNYFSPGQDISNIIVAKLSLSDSLWVILSLN